MTFNITEFTSNLNAVNGLAKSNKFIVTITTPIDNGDGRTIRLLCEQATFPGISWSTSEIRPTGYGNTIKRPTNAVFTDAELVFLCDSDGVVVNYFHNWMSNINHFDKSQFGERNSLNLYQFNYPDEYTGTVLITNYEETGKKISEITLNDAFPLTVSNQQLGWDQSDSLLRLSTTFAYDSWSSNHISN